MDLININVSLPSKQYSEVEEYCVNKAVSISDYFLYLHEINMSEGWTMTKEKQKRTDDLKDFHTSFEKMAHHKNESNCIDDGKIDLDHLDKSSKHKKK